MTKLTKTLALGASALAVSASMALAGGHSTTVCLITKTDTNPFFVKMKEGATGAAALALLASPGVALADHHEEAPPPKR